jgi:hypothetical protein
MEHDSIKQVKGVTHSTRKGCHVSIPGTVNVVNEARGVMSGPESAIRRLML